jgi:hypothetical protein
VTSTRKGVKSVYTVYGTRTFNSALKVSTFLVVFPGVSCMFNGTKMQVNHGGRGDTGQRQWKESEQRHCRRSSTHIYSGRCRDYRYSFGKFSQ